MILTTLSNCKLITVEDQDIENWVNGDLLDLTISIFKNCTSVASFELPNQYNFSYNISSCTTPPGTVDFTLNILGITDVEIETINITNSSNIVSATQVTETQWLISSNNIPASIEYTILDTQGNTFTLTFNEVNNGGTLCSTNTFNLTTNYSSVLPCGFEIVGNNLNIYAEVLASDCIDCSGDLTTCRAFCDGIWSIQFNNSTGCIFLDCETECLVVEKYTTCREDVAEIIKIYESVVRGSNLTSQGRTDCITCSQLCDLYKYLMSLLEINCEDSPCIKTIPNNDCGC